MRILQINTVYGEGSTGKIARELHDLCVSEGIACRAACRQLMQPTEDAMEISGHLDSRLHGVLARFTMLKGCFSYWKTRRFLKEVKAWGPDVIHLHNLHGSYINIGLLMRYIKRHRIPVVCTLHDCWAFTGICSHFTIAGCDRWKMGCGQCPQRKQYSSAPVDLSKTMWSLKREWFSNVENMTIVTPSQWLGGLVQQSFLGRYPVKIINNGINLGIFKPTPSDFRKKYGLQEKKIVLGVAFGWGYAKGLDVMVELADRLPDDYQLVLVGTDEAIEAELPSNILTIRRTSDQQELAEIYTAADVFVNPTREETYPTVNMEAIACGTPVVTFRTGGSPEMVSDTCGAVVDGEDLDALEREVIRICTERVFSAEMCARQGAKFDKNKRMMEYIHLYMNLGKEGKLQ